MSIVNLTCKSGTGCDSKATKYLSTKRYGVIGYCNPCGDSFTQAQQSMPASLRRELQPIR